MRAILAAMAAILVMNSHAAAAVSKPPKRYDHAHPALILVQKSYRAIDPLCRSKFPRSQFPAATDTHRITGCAEIGNGRHPCRIFIPKRGEGILSEGRIAAIIRHERAHCNGWPASHPRS